jgi:type VII secretion protein EccB
VQKRDQLHAHRHLVGRLVSAMVHGHPEAEQPAMRRANLGSVLGVALGLLGMAGAAALGMFLPRPDQGWRNTGTIIVEQETGNRYLLIDGVLYPTLNFASARLAAGEGGGVLRTVPRATLDGLPHGHPIGIPGAPDAVPDASRLLSAPWLVCAVTLTLDGAEQRGVHLRIGATAGTAPVPGGRGVLAATADGGYYLLWQDRRFRFAGQAAKLALGYGSVAPVFVPPQWLNALQAGPDLALPEIGGRGDPGPEVGSVPTRVGQVLEVPAPSGASTAHYLVLPGGLAPVTPTYAALVLGDPRTQAAYAGGLVGTVPVQAAAVAGHLIAPAGVTGYPPVPPDPADTMDGSRSLCVRFTFGGNGAAAQLATVGLDDLSGGRSTGAARKDDPRVADLVTVAPDSGAVAGSIAAPGVWGRDVYLITDLGVKYPLSDARVAAVLGFANPPVVRVPGDVLAFLPTGPVLDPGAAAVEQRGKD